MKKMIAGSVALAISLAVAAPALADLLQDAPAPDFTTQTALGGKEMKFNLNAALRKGPVVLYFYPKSFTDGCTVEAHAFAEATAKFRKMGATVIGLSADDIETQKRFSTKECSSKFQIGVATPAIIAAYDVHLKRPDGTATGRTSRTSYVIGTDHKVHMVYNNMNPNEHVARATAAVAAMRAARRK